MSDAHVILERLAASAGLRMPAALTVAITGACNLRCRHCFVEAGLPGAAGDAPVRELLRLADELAALGGRAIRLTGGEPLSHPEWPAILSHCCSLAPLASVRIQTNASLVDGAGAAELAALANGKLLFEVSLDGTSPQTHDRVRGRGSWAKTMAGLERLTAAGLAGRVEIAFTEMRHNMEDLPELLDLGERLQLRAIVGGTLVKHGSAARAALEPPAPDQYRALLARYHSDARFRALYEKRGRLSAIEWWKGRLGARGSPCNFLDHPYVASDGTLYPCLLCHDGDFSVARAFERPLAAALAEGIPRWAELQRLARDRTEALSASACRECPAKLACAGGCMGRAHAAGGSLAETEDRCALRQAAFAWTAETEGDAPAPCSCAWACR